MAKTGLKKYDELPGRIGFTDVDFLRYKYTVVEKRMIDLIEKLNKARIKWKEKNGT